MLTTNQETRRWLHLLESLKSCQEHEEEDIKEEMLDIEPLVDKQWIRAQQEYLP